MGWLYGWDTNKQLRDHIRQELGGLLAPEDILGNDPARAVVQGLAGSKRGIVKDSLVAYGRRYYAAFQPGDGTVTIVMCLFNRMSDRGQPGTAEWGYKDMDESCGPCDKDCPLTILELATDPPPNEWAKTWRAEVRAYWAKRREQLRAGKAVAVGSHIYTTGGRHYRVTGVNPIRGYNDEGGYFRIPATHIARVEAPTP
jgi:hypothetical protein